MKIIGHRGAAGLALENSQESLLLAKQYELDAIEFDVRLTKDGHLVVLHDSHTGRVANKFVRARTQTLAQLKKLILKNDQRILSLDEALSLLKDTNVIIELKDRGIAEKLPAIIARHPNVRVSFCSFLRSELVTAHRLLPGIPIYLSTRLLPILGARMGKKLGASGVFIPKWLPDPVAYRLARRYGLQVFMYTINSPRAFRLLHKIYPELLVFTNHPERFLEVIPKVEPARGPDSTA